MQNPTETIRAAHNLTIELGLASWRLVNGTADPNRPGVQIALVEARADSIICSPAFTRARQLPNDGQLLPADVARVVVGWAPESQNWHLGLWMAARPDSGFKPRWCGLASWPSSGDDYGGCSKNSRAVSLAPDQPPFPSGACSPSAALARPHGDTASSGNDAHGSDSDKRTVGRRPDH